MDEAGKRRKDPAAWEQRYVDDDLPWDRQSPDAHLKGVLHDFAMTKGKVLDIGCGTGTNGIWLDALGFEVTGFDVSPTAIEKARAKAHAAASGAQFKVGNFLTDPVPNAPFNLVLDRGCFHIFEEAADRAHFAARVAELLAPEGIWHSLLGSTDGPPRDTGPPRRSALEIMEALEPHFEIISLQSTFFDEDSHAEARAWVLVARRREH